MSSFRNKQSSIAASDVQGPASATDNAIVRYDGTTGKIIQNSNATIGDNGETSIGVTSGTGVPLTVTVDSSGASQNALHVQNNTNFAHSGDLVRLRFRNGSDSGVATLIENEGTGKSLDVRRATISRFSVSNVGKIEQETTITSGGTTGNQTINKPTGTVNFAAAATAITVTNSLCTTSSTVFAVVRTNDTTAVIKNVVPGNGSFVITLNAAATAETSVGFWVIN